MQLNKAVPFKHSNRERWRDYGMIYIFLQPVDFIRSLALNKLLLNREPAREVLWGERVGKAHAKAASSRGQSQPRYFRIYLQALGRRA